MAEKSPRISTTQSITLTNSLATCTPICLSESAAAILILGSNTNIVAVNATWFASTELQGTYVEMRTVLDATIAQSLSGLYAYAVPAETFAASFVKLKLAAGTITGMAVLKN